MRESIDVACVPCRRRGLSAEQCGPSTLGPEAERRLARNRGEHTLDTQNDVRTNDSAHGTRFTDQHAATANALELAPDLPFPFTWEMQTTPDFNPHTYPPPIASKSIPADHEFESRLHVFLLANCSAAAPETLLGASDACRKARLDHNHGTHAAKERN